MNDITSSNGYSFFNIQIYETALLLTKSKEKHTLHALRDHLVASPLHRNDVALLAHAEGVHRRLRVQLQSADYCMILRIRILTQSNSGYCRRAYVVQLERNQLEGRLLVDALETLVF